MFSSHLHTWIKVASLHKGRWRHKMAVVQGQVGTPSSAALGPRQPSLDFLGQALNDPFFVRRGEAPKRKGTHPKLHNNANANNNNYCNSTA